eukprot:CAMPEP_0168742076 /NCGR_PEP_ID=MMETSP0724-20121128/12850_1 /TAXON_ID=265536 /ORGANISM="Amphiprora sp., Strain CCMP467" /LENGTH=502 /DNA_ID=CAMNT_0008789615 /DNA_START=6 /DNA_END=1514 /DNA_ORIENTATION=-
MDVQLPEFFTNFLDASLEKVYALEPVFEPTVVLVPDFLKEIVKYLADLIGFDVPTLSFTVAIYLCYVLGGLMNFIPAGKPRHIANILFGVFLMQFTVGVQWMHQLVNAVVTYVMFLVLPRKTAAFAVPAFVMTYCVLGHLHRQYINYLGWDLDFTSSQMVITQKLWMMAYNLYDGDLIAKGKESRAAKKCAPFALKDLPDFIEYLGYVFSFTTVLSGPAYEFSIYKQACDGSHLYDANGKPQGEIPSNVWPTLRPFLLGLFSMAAFVVVGGAFPILDTEDPQKNTPYVTSPEFLEKSIFYRYAYMWIGLWAVRQKYIMAWTNSEASNNIWYAGFEGFDDNGKAKGWDNANNMGIWEFETAPNVQTMSKEWNKKTSLWLTRYVYIRTNGSLVAVYGMSAFWHGFYPGYYLFFLSVPLLTFCERLGKKKISPYFSKEKWTPYGILCIISTSVATEYMVAAFVLLALDRTFDYWKSMYFFGHIGCIVFYAVLSVMPTPKPKGKKA